MGALSPYGMSAKSHTFKVQSPDHMSQIAAQLGARLRGGNVVLLEGDVGAGKTHFARSLIQYRLGRAEDVPSPTFTLVQTYECAEAEIWHADLYRLTSTQEVEELGLLDAFETDICLIEWPDRLGDLAPDNALWLRFVPGDEDDARVITASWRDSCWDDVVKACFA